MRMPMFRACTCVLEGFANSAGLLFTAWRVEVPSHHPRCDGLVSAPANVTYIILGRWTQLRADAKGLASPSRNFVFQRLPKLGFVMHVRFNEQLPSMPVHGLGRCCVRCAFHHPEVFHVS